ncbi:hypothetical protein KUH03_17535 [Sphingobacterium sp. E70]|uniref:hypothetical protein n=1 Tax=Sphingobacterium sp. E70 TaxID=2853439 RepID=UPI00211B7EF7|nr:hypothetical protein [Sphingobacterium sp. E70]ULT28232.1 hypothetical protein KUH03_17535 [Sphingobacterium sp. E70]
MKFVNNPNPIVPQHTKPIAYLGGAGIFGGIISISILFFLFNFETINDTIPIQYIIPMSFGSSAYLLLGIIDDKIAFKALTKLLFQIVIAFICISLGLRGNFVTTYILDVFITLFWIVLLVNASNLIDVCDGLLAGIMVITLLILSTCFHTTTIFCYIVAGSTLGFLCFNFPPASIF